MSSLSRQLIAHPLTALALGGAIVRGVIEWAALWRCRRQEHRGVHRQP